ncbi:MAG: methionine--tRNA ligase [Clostridia bacterium]|nr:methionine--tRNA ligase [Clostridia bacterium]
MNEQTSHKGEKFYITTAIAYASRKPHIGNTYEIIMTDAVARFRKLQGYDVFFLTGTDEHGEKIEDYAKKAGITPQAYVDGVSAEIRKLWDLMNCRYDHFIRTTDEQHVKAVQKIFKRFYDQGDIYKNEYEGWYCVPCESFYTETQAAGGKCPDCGAPMQRKKEEAYFFRMSAYQDRLLEYIETHPGFIEPEARKKEMINNFIKPGLQDLCVSRTSFQWGIPVTFDEKHVVYVWVDALSNYITALGYDVDGSGDLYKKYWPADVHVIGKDIMRFHSIYWPIFLMALGEPLPKKIFGHPWFLFGNDKMSKSKGNVLYADQLVQLFGVDGVRHYCLSEMPYSSDGNITLENLAKRYNADLANNLGNLVSRTLAMTQKYFGGVIPAPSEKEAVDEELAAFSRTTCETVFQSMDTYHVSDAENALFSLFGRANKYIDETMPWVLAKDPEKKDRLGTVLYNLLETIRFGAVLLGPFLPSASESILNQLGTQARDLTPGSLLPGHPVGEAAPLFSRIDEKKLIETMESEQKQNAEESAKANEALSVSPESPKTGFAPVLPELSFERFSETDLRCARVLACEPIPKSSKLLKLQLDLGFERRQVVSGIAKAYRPEQLIGKKVLLVANLAPVKLCGEDSFGMILAGGEGSGIQVVLLPDDMAPGTRIH